MKYLITGVSGFVSGHYIEYLLTRSPGTEIIGIDLSLPDFSFLSKPLKEKITVYKASLLEKELIKDLVGDTRPDYIVNLASFSSVADSWRRPVDYFINNTTSFLNIIEAVRKTSSTTKILAIGSSETYGAVDRKDIPLTETTSPNPGSPYAAARVAQEQLSKVYTRGYSVPIIMTRSFNHIGPRQKETFVISSFAKQIAEVKKGKRDKIICGNLDAVRDFLDVRDVVRAYDALLQKGTVGETYNVCSGEAHALSDILAMMQEAAQIRVPVERDPDLMRPVDSPIIVGSNEKLIRDTGFRRRFTLPESLATVVKYWEER
jgi:GDP-4-dehydro-6-deoxy-D-mannose reductase